MALSTPNCTLSNDTILLTDLEWSSTETISILAILPSLMILGDVANLAFLYTVVTIPRMHTVANLYLANLAITDMLFVSHATISYVVSYLVTPIRSAVIKTQIGCWAAFLPSAAFYYVSLEMVFLVSLERYYAVCQPLKHRAFTKLVRGKADIIISWLLGIIFAVPSTLKWGDITSINFCTKKMNASKIQVPFVQTIYICQSNHHQFVINLVSEIIPTVLFLVTITASSILYIKVLNNLNAQTKTTLKSSKTHIAKVKNQIALVLIVNGVLFFICQLPYRFYSVHQILADIFQVWSLEEHHLQLLIISSRLFLYINSTINPFVYGAESRFYRNAFLEAFGLCGTKDSNTSGSSGARSSSPDTINTRQ